MGGFSWWLLAASVTLAQGMINVYTLLAHPTQQFYWERSMPGLRRLIEERGRGQLQIHHYWYTGAMLGSSTTVADREGYLKGLAAIVAEISQNPGHSILFTWDISMYGPGWFLNLTRADFAALEALRVPVLWQDQQPFESYLNTVLLPDDFGGAFQIATVFCSLLGEDKGVRTLLTLRGPYNQTNSEARVRGFNAGLVANGCADRVSMPADLDANCDWDNEKARIFTRRAFARAHVDGIFACNDVMADGAIQAALALRPQGTSGLLISGYDAIPTGVQHVIDGTMYATAHNAMFWESHGMLPKLMTLFLAYDYEEPTGLGTVFWPTAVHMAVMDSFVRRLLLQGYQVTNSPQRETQVHTVITCEYLTDVNMKDGHFELSGSMDHIWVDQRLKYMGDIWRLDSLDMQAEEVWIPRMEPQEYIEWETDVIELKVSPDGVVSMVERFTLKSKCVYGIALFPADRHRCEVVFQPNVPGGVVATFETNVSSYALAGWRRIDLMSWVRGHITDDKEAVFTLYLTRDIAAFILPVLLPTFVVTVSTLASLEMTIPKEDRVKMVMVGFLTAFTLRGTVLTVAPLTGTIMWLDWWFLLSILYQMSTIIVIVWSAKENPRIAKISDNACLCCHRRVRTSIRNSVTMGEDFMVGMDSFGDSHKSREKCMARFGMISYIVISAGMVAAVTT